MLIFSTFYCKLGFLVLQLTPNNRVYFPLGPNQFFDSTLAFCHPSPRSGPSANSAANREVHDFFTQKIEIATDKDHAKKR